MLEKALPQRTRSTPQAVIHSTVPFVKWLPGEGQGKARETSASPGVLSETKILRLKDRPLKYIEKCSELGWVVVGFLKGKIASLIKEIVWFFWPVLLRKLGNGTFPWTVSEYGAQGYCGLRTQL